MYAPIALFTYNRLKKTQLTVEALTQNKEAADSDLIVFSDGAKGKSDADAVIEVRHYLRTIQGFNSVRIIERDMNLGLAQSIITGVTQIIKEVGCVIVLEDDLLTSPYFLRYMNDGLQFYAREERVISIHGYTYPVEQNLPETFLLHGADCLGWATWKRGWDLFEADGQKLLKKLRKSNLLNRFNYFGAYDYSGMLRAQIKGKNQSWAVRWYASALLQNKLTLYPGRTLVQHIGSDGSGTHCVSDAGKGLFNEPVSDYPIHINSSIRVEECNEALMAFTHFLKELRIPLPYRILQKLRRMIRWN